MKEIVSFVIAFIIPFIYYRTLFAIARPLFDKPFKKNGIQIHHLHYGAVLILVSTILLLFLGKNVWVVVMLGIGLGLVFDEFIGSLYLPEQRPLGLELYHRSFRKTLTLFLAIAIALFVGALLYF